MNAGHGHDCVAEYVERRFGAFLRSVVNPGAAERDAYALDYPRAVMQAAADTGLFSYSLPRELGGANADTYDWGLVLEEIGYLSDDCSFPALLSARVWITDTLYRTGRADLIDRYVRPMANAELFGAFAYSDGADPFNFSSTLRHDGASLVLDGHKPIVTGATDADVFVVFVNDEATGDLAAVLVERADEGADVERIDTLGMRGLGLGALRLENVRVPSDRLIAEFDALTFAQRMLNSRRVLLVAALTGAMRATHDYCIRQLGATERYGVPLVEMQNVQAALGRQYVAVESSRAILHRALAVAAGRTGAFDASFDPVVSAAKHEITRHGIDVAISAMRLLGGRGYLRGRAERFLRDTCALLAAAGAQDVLEIDLGVRAVTDSYEDREEVRS